MSRSETADDAIQVEENDASQPSASTVRPHRAGSVSAVSEAGDVQVIP